MNKTKFFSSLLVGAMFLASASVVTSCKDYDDDIKNLQTQIDQNTSAISAIQTLIQNGKVLQSVESISGGIRITIDGTPYEIKNGTDGANGTVWTIGADGYWYKDGVATTYYALGTKGDKGDKGDKGEKGEKGADGVNADGSSKYYVPNATTGTFWIYNDGDKQPYDSGISFIVEVPGQGATITAVRTNDMLTLYGVEGGEGALRAVAISLNGTLKSLVFIPHFYLDGIETIEYPWFGDSTLVKAPALATYPQNGTDNRSKMIHHGKTIAGNGVMYNYLPDNLSHLPQGPISGRSAVIYGPVIGVDYEMNPSNSVLTWDDNLPTYKVLEPDVVYANTRAAATTLNISSPKTYGRYTEDADVFGIHAASSMNNSNVNYLTAGLKIGRPDYLEPYPTSQDINGGYLPTTLDASYTLPWGTWYQWYKDDSGIHKDTDNTIALQMHNIDDADVTSDYALLIPSRIRLEGLIWNKTPQYVEPGFGPEAVVTGDEKGWYSVNDQIFVWDSPEEALDNNMGAALELPIGETVDLKSYLGIRILKENVKTRTLSTKDWAANEHITSDGKSYGEEEYYDLHYEFSLIDYEVSGNVTRDSRYARFEDTETQAARYSEDSAHQGVGNGQAISASGKILALSVNEIQETIEQGSTTAVDREPLVRVLVKNKAGQVMLDGYILLHITNTNPNLNITTYSPQDRSFDLCNGVAYETTWAQFSKHVLQDALKNYEKLTFDYFYWAECNTGTTTVTPPDKPYVTENAQVLGSAADGHMYYSMKLYNFGENSVPPAIGTDGLIATNDLGEVRYYPNSDGQTNHKWDWVLSAKEVENLTHDKAATEFPIVVTRWVRFQAKTFTEANANIPAGITKYTQDNYNAPYPYIWVKMQLKLTREANKTGIYATKLDNWWYHYDSGIPTGWSGILFDIEAPRGGVIQQTTNTGASIKDKNWDSFISYTLKDNAINSFSGTGKYYFAPITYTLAGYTITPQRSTSDSNFDKLICKYNASDKHTWSEGGLEALLTNGCAIDYNNGVFNNTILYAKKGSVYTPIAYIVDPDYNSSDALADKIKAGQIRLVHWLDASGNISDVPTAYENTVAYEVLNAIGYKEHNENINVQLRAWLGFVGNNGCGVAYYVGQKELDEPHVATFLTSWERPINLLSFAQNGEDAKTTENTVYLIDNILLYDWRGDKPNYDGYMYDGHWWYWGNYNIKALKVDLRTNIVRTNINGSWDTLNNVTNTLHLYNLNRQANTLTVYNSFGDLTQYNDPSSEADIERVMGISPVNKANKAKFGGFYYENNSGNVTEFDVEFPITVVYEWGELTQNVQFHIDTTHGHE